MGELLISYEGDGRRDTEALNGDVPNCHRVPSTGVRSPGT